MKKKKQPTPFDNFENLAQRVLSVPLGKVKQAEKKKRKQRKRKAKK